VKRVRTSFSLRTGFLESLFWVLFLTFLSKISSPQPLFVLLDPTNHIGIQTAYTGHKLLTSDCMVTYSSAACHTIVAFISQPGHPHPPHPVILNLLIGTLGSFSEIGRSYIVPVAPNLAHLGFFIALYWCLHSGRVQQQAYS
jgi:hypothetical protein